MRPFDRARPRGGSESGFTLVEIMVALGVLVFGVVSLIGVMGVGVSERRGAEQRMRASRLADRVLRQVETELLAGELGSAMDSDGSGGDEALLAVAGVDDVPAEGDLGMKYSVRFTSDLDTPTIVLVTVEISWLEQGASVAQKFHRVVPRGAPFSQRVQKHRRSS